ncbi:biotin--[acetyl-CoA-carboxylase] ligase [Bradyrhizobium sp. SSBR45G]|uniref:biotin--[acetyl-CoA-carboxylase] ligase n=1 Tax=unclassified Bradyrhizobium TaxID=2631580 RepID=UPI002342BC12|nr:MULTISPECIES: biotin--[acetyl-CoA-carboxylase] ligase [unclassified Bradyrhizobium]GLH75870.1 biotin--[acetyl-CoA-carboxylase] ligase [Bradyrhizobium sp. SSBR45G]GLH85107.1 biotin--[acetyl-CoA-carboxylase] ligase [Bradyrhizobium sp. SSBR45R]
MTFALGVRAAKAGYGLVVFDQAGSTNVEALKSFREGAKAPCWFVTTEQTAGRGRRQRPWIAPRGNLASSVVEVLDVAPAVAATLGFAACLAIASALRQVSLEATLRSGGSAGLDFAVKWPNDVLAGGRKIVGMLLEAEQVAGRLAVVAGIGTNVVAAPTDTPTPAVSLADLGVQVTAEDLFSALSDAWVEYFGIWNEGRGFGEIRRLWLERAAGLGQPVAIRSGHAIIEGIFDTIDEQGCMLVRTAEGRLEPITAGDVHFGSVASKGAV